MKDILNKIFGAAGGGVAEKLSGIVDKFVQTKEEKAAFEKLSVIFFMSNKRKSIWNFAQPLSRL